MSNNLHTMGASAFLIVERGWRMFDQRHAFKVKVIYTAVLTFVRRTNDNFGPQKRLLILFRPKSTKASMWMTAIPRILTRYQISTGRCKLLCLYERKHLPIFP